MYTVTYEIEFKAKLRIRRPVPEKRFEDMLRQVYENAEELIRETGDDFIHDIEVGTIREIRKQHFE